VIIASAGGLLVIGVITNAVGSGKNASNTSAASSPTPSSSRSPITRSSAAAVAKPTPTPPVKPPTGLAVYNWYEAAGKPELAGIETAMSTFSTDAAAGNDIAAGQDCSTFASAVTAAEVGAPIPAPRAEKWFTRALSHYQEGAANCQAGTPSQSATLVLQAADEFGVGNTDIARTTRVIESLDS
jgi:hypothetical protein